MRKQFHEYEVFHQTAARMLYTRAKAKEGLTEEQLNAIHYDFDWVHPDLYNDLRKANSLLLMMREGLSDFQVIAALITTWENMAVFQDAYCAANVAKWF